MEKRYHLLYKVTNIETRKEYIGVHSTNDIEDGYMGSGTLLRKDIKLFGVGNFSGEIIDTFENRIELLNAERSIVNQDYLLTADTYNMVCGGGGVGIIYSKRANKLHISKVGFKKFDKDYQYIFDFSKSGIVKPNYKRGVLAEKVMDIIVSNWNKVEYDISLLWNNVYTNKIAKTFITKLLNYKGLSGQIQVDLFDWDGNYLKTNVLVLE